MLELVNAYRLSVGKPGGAVGEDGGDSIEMDLQKPGWKNVNLFSLVEGKGLMLSCCEHGNEGSGFVKRETFLE